MGHDPHKTALELLLDEYQERRGPDLPDQLDLFAEPAEAADEAPATGTQVTERRGRGRPPGSRNKRTDELGRHYVAVAGHGRDPFARLVYIAGLPILEPGVLDQIAKLVGLEKGDAARWWSGIALGVMPYLHQRLAQLTVVPDGAPGSGHPVLWSMNDDEAIDVTPEPPLRDGTTG